MGVQELRVQDLRVDLGGRAVLDGIDLAVTAGQSIAVTGPSGSGKTVLLHTLAGLIHPAGGHVWLDGKPLDQATLRHAPIGLILQHHGLASGLTAVENIALPLQQRGLTREEITVRCHTALEAVDLEAAGQRMVDELSGGQRQRIGVARALAGEPSVVLADEPTAELDPVNRALVLSALLDPSAQRIVLIVANDPDLVEACDGTIRLYDGRIQSDE
jgi:putative ABC transport system ATP-binding protein